MEIYTRLEELFRRVCIRISSYIGMFFALHLMFLLLIKPFLCRFDRDRSGTIDEGELMQAFTTFGYRL